jgi:hypothetical protein
VNTGPGNATVGKVWRREDGRCARCGFPITGDRGQGWSIHHRAPRGSGGAKHVGWMNLPSNLLLLCGSGTTGCHGWVEAHRQDALDLGFLVLRNGRLLPGDVPVHHATLGLVLLTDDGDAIDIGSVA